MARVTRQVADQLKRVPPLYRAARRVRERTNAGLPPRRLAGLGPVHRNDLMLAGTDPVAVEVYRRVGAGAVELLEQAVASTGADPDQVDSVLDFGSGYARVLRAMRGRWPEARLTAVDLDPVAVRFCAKHFDAVPVVSNPAMTGIALEPHDVTWLGSVITHLPESGWNDLLKLVLGSAEPGAVVVFSAHGESCLDRLDSYATLPKSAATAVAAEFAEYGFAYRPYSHYRGADYGVAFHHPDRVVADVRSVGGEHWNLVWHRPAAWIDHHDVYAFELRP